MGIWEGLERGKGRENDVNIISKAMSKKVCAGSQPAY